MDEEIYCKGMTRSEYDRQYYLANKERKLDNNRKWRTLNPDKKNEQGRRYYRRHKEEVLARTNTYSREHADERAIAQKVKYAALPTNDRIDTGRWYRYGLTKEQLWAIFEAQDQKCLICNIVLEFYSRDTHIDHDHTCCSLRDKCCGKCVRGFLCRKHNQALGNFGDDPETLRRAADYVESFRRTRGLE